MANLILNGSTSGSVTLSSPAVSGTTTLTLPTTTGTLGIVSGDLGTPSALVGTNITGTANALNAGIGVNQTWQVLTGSRSAGTTYTNSTGKPIAVSILLASSLSISDNILTVGGVVAWKIYNNNVRDQTAFTIVPNGSTYVLTLGSGASIAAWYELR